MKERENPWRYNRHNRAKCAKEKILGLNEDLEQKVREHTRELERKYYELEQMNKAFVGRELRMAELKERWRKNWHDLAGLPKAFGLGHLSEHHGDEVITRRKLLGETVGLGVPGIRPNQRKIVHMEAVLRILIGVMGKWPGIRQKVPHVMNAGRRKSLSAMLVAVLLMGGATAAWAQEKPGSPPPVRDWVDRIKNPVDWFKWGADVRLRNDSIENPYLTDADPPGHSYSFERLRVREWNTFSPCKEFEFNLRFTWEGRHYWMPASKEEWDESEVVFDNLNGKFKFQEIPVTLIVGRQDIVFGEGWLVSDGTPLDGPRPTISTPSAPPSI